MLSFATEFPIKSNDVVALFQQTLISWIIESPYTEFNKDDLKEAFQEKEFQVSKGSQFVIINNFSDIDKINVGVIHKTTDIDVLWTTTIVLSVENSSSWISIRTEAETQNLNARLPKAKKPFIVKSILKRVGGAPDGYFCVTDKPHILAESNIATAADIIRGNSKQHLPIIYVSIDFLDSYIVNVDRISKTLSGMAHVVIEPSRHFSRRLQVETGGQNVYGGTVGLYWPHASGRRSFFIGKSFEGPKDIESAIEEEVRSALLNRQPLFRCTWTSVRENLNLQAIEDIKSSGSQEIDDYIRHFDEEKSLNDLKIQSLNDEIFRLKSEIGKLEAQTSARGDLSFRVNGEQKSIS